MPAKPTVKKVTPEVSGLSAEKAPLQSGVTAPKTVTFNMDIWYSFAAGVLRSKHRLALDGDYATDPAYLEALEMFEIENNKRATDYPSAIVAGQAFDEWLDRTEWVYEAPVLFVATGFHVSVTVPVGNGNITLGMDYSSVGHEPEISMRAAYDYLQAAVKATFPAQKQTLSASGSTSTAPKTPDFVTEHFSKLISKEYKGKMGWRLIPSEGKWTQFGVPIYPDVAKKFAIELPEEPDMEYDINWNCGYELTAEGKPRRIVSIVDA